MSAPRTCKLCGLWIPRGHPFTFCSRACELDYWHSVGVYGIDSRAAWRLGGGPIVLDDYKEIPSHVTASELRKEYNGK
jgi:hypothetical protein